MKKLDVKEKQNLREESLKIISIPKEELENLDVVDNLEMKVVLTADLAELQHEYDTKYLSAGLNILDNLIKGHKEKLKEIDSCLSSDIPFIESEEAIMLNPKKLSDKVAKPVTLSVTEKVSYNLPLNTTTWDLLDELSNNSVDIRQQIFKLSLLDIDKVYKLMSEIQKSVVDNLLASGKLNKNISKVIKESSITKQLSIFDDLEDIK